MSYPSYAAVGWTDIAEEISDELSRVRKKSPSADYLVTAMAEKAGEAVRAALNVMYAELHGDPLDEIRSCYADLRKELIQTAAMCIRLIREGDPIHHLKKEDQRP